NADWYASYRPDALVLDEIHDFEVKDNSSWAETRQVRMKVLTYSGKKDFSDFRIAYNPTWDEVKLKNAFVTSPAGVRTTIHDKEINIMDADWVGGARRYPASKIMVVSLPGVEEGSIIDYTVLIKRKGRPFFSIHGEPCLLDHEGTGDYQSLVGMGPVLQYTIPIERKTVRIHVPTSLKIRIAPLPDIPEGSADSSRTGGIRMKSMRKGSGVIHEITAVRMPPLKKEDNLPPWYALAPMIFSSSGTWKDYAGDVGKHLNDAVSDSRETERITADLLKDISGSSNRIRAIRDHVAKSIRLIPSSFHDLPLSTITKADRVLSDGYGNSADRAVALYAMLKAAGFNPEFVLASWVSDVDDLKKPLMDYPAPHWFGDVLVRIRDGEATIYLNDTDQYAALGTTSYAGKPCLEVKGGGVDTVRHLSDQFEEKAKADV
ncbi:DUF3857 domain-containing protein, partial [bacterium]|nr:DUF3857 domain-containing protein [bacterium]